MSLIRLLSDHVAATTYQNVPPEVVDRTKQSILDNLGNLLAGRYSDKGEGFIQYAARWKNHREATIPGYGKVALEAAAFANAGFSRIMDLDDGHRAAMGHPGVVIIPSVLALGEVLDSSATEAIAAIVAAYDVYIEIGSTINPSSYTEKGFDTTGVAGVVAVAAAAAKLHRFDREGTKNAMAIAALHAGGFIEYLTDGSSGKLLCPGWTTATGLRAIEMAGCGFTGPDTVLEGRKGLFQCFSSKYDTTGFGTALGRCNHIMTTYFKVHSCLRRLHQGVDALLSLREKHALTPASVKAIQIGAGPFVVEADSRRPKTLVAGQGSMPFVLGVALKHGLISRETLEAGMDDAEVHAIEDKVRIVLSKKIVDYQAQNPSAWGAVEMDVETFDGRRVSEWTPLAFGEPEMPLSWKQLEAKFAALVNPTIAVRKASAIISAARRLEEFASVAEFVRQVDPAHGDELPWTTGQSA